MAQNETKKLDKKTLQQDKEAIAAVKVMTGYAPANTAYTVEKIVEADEELDEIDEQVVQARAALKALEDRQTAAQWKRHNLVLGMGDQVKAQFGKNSDEYQAIGYKKTSEYARRRPRAQNNNPTT